MDMVTAESHTFPLAAAPHAPASSGVPIAAGGIITRRDILVETRPKHDTAATVAVASISDQDWYISRTHGVYHIPSCAKGKSHALLLLTSRGDVIDLGDNRRFPFTISAREIAEDLLQDLYDHGVFLCDGPRPTAEELAAATTRRDAYYHRLIAEGDTLWARGHSFREISDLHRRAALALGIEREWAYVPMRMNECPACAEKVKAGVAVCKHCGAILDEEKAAKHGLGPGAKRAAPTGGPEPPAQGNVDDGDAAENRTAPGKRNPSAGAAERR
jgi:hypothetical protein